MNHTNDELLEAATKLKDTCQNYRTCVGSFSTCQEGCPFEGDGGRCSIYDRPLMWKIPEEDPKPEDEEPNSESFIWERIASDGAKRRVESDGNITYIAGGRIYHSHPDPVGPKGRDAETRPPHYDLEPEPIEVIKAWNLDFCLGNVLKYIARAGHKDGETRDSDLHKAMQYLRFELEDEGKKR